MQQSRDLSEVGPTNHVRLTSHGDASDLLSATTRLQRDRERDHGFTLVELLVVVVIMGVLATVSVLGVQGLTDRGQETACEADQRVLEIAIETWLSDESLSAGTLTQAALVQAELLRDESTLFEVDALGTVTPVEGGACDQA